jgi:dGTPase
MLNGFLPGGFRHEAHSLRVVDTLAQGGKGLNLTRAVRDGIVCHNGERMERALSPEAKPRLPEEKLTAEFYPATWEGCAVRMADRIAYLGRDMEDAMTAGLLSPSDLPAELGPHAENLNSFLIDSFVEDIVTNSPKEGCLALTEEAFHNYNVWYGFNVERIYRHPMLQEYEARTTRILDMLLDALCRRSEAYLDDPGRALKDAEGPDILYQDFAQFYLELTEIYQKGEAPRLTADYVAGMTDQFALEQVRRLLWPRPIA